MSNSLQPHGLQHARPPCPSPTPGAWSNSCPLSGWYHLTITSSVTPSPSVFSLSQHQGLFQRVGSLYQMAKYWSFSFNIIPSNEHSGLNSFRINCLDHLKVQGTLKSLLQHHSSKPSIPYSIPITTIPLGFGVRQAESEAITTHWEIFLHLDAWQKKLLYFQGNLWNR